MINVSKHQRELGVELTDNDLIAEFMDHMFVQEYERIEYLWPVAAKIREVAVPDPQYLLKPWMPIAMALQAVDAQKLFQAVLNFINEYNRLQESKRVKEDSEGATTSDEGL